MIPLFKLNFIGVGVADFASSLAFYAQTLGIELRHTKPDWAYLETTGMIFELFGGAPPPPADRAWGRGQAVRPAILLDQLAETVTALRDRNATFSTDVEPGRWGDAIELVAPEGIRWSLVQAEPGGGLRRPHLGGVEMKVHDLAAQQRFYNEHLGLSLTANTSRSSTLRQQAGEPLLRLEAGSESKPRQRAPSGQPRAEQPVSLSFETADAARAAAYLKARHVPLVQDVTEKPWGGIDAYFRDADGVPFQVVQYL